MATSLTVITVFCLLALVGGMVHLVESETLPKDKLYLGSYPFLQRIGKKSRYGDSWHTKDGNGNNLLCMMSFNGMRCRRQKKLDTQ